MRLAHHIVPDLVLFLNGLPVVVTCRQEARFGTISTCSEKHFYRWTDPYPPHRG